MAFAYFDNDKWNEITGDFTHEGADYTMLDLAVTSIEDLAELGIVGIEDNIPETDGSLGERTLDDLEGKPVWNYQILPAVDLAEDARKASELASAKQAIEDRIQRAYDRGYLIEDTALAGERLQCRNPDDKSNWLVSQNAYDKKIAAGHGDVAGAVFRTMSDRTVVVSFTVGSLILDGLSVWGFKIMGRGWALKDALKKGIEYDLEAGWPA